jgi:hypothetical protein
VLEEIKLRLTQPSLVELGFGLSLAKMPLFFYSDIKDQTRSSTTLELEKNLALEHIIPYN